MQGLTVGALVEGLPIANGRYVGGELGWLSAFALLCGFSVCIGYSLLGACWLARKCHGEVRDLAYRLIPFLSVALLLFLIAVFISDLLMSQFFKDFAAIPIHKSSADQCPDTGSQRR